MARTARAHTWSAGGRAANDPRLVAHVQASSQGVRQNKLDDVTLAFVGALIGLLPVWTHVLVLARPYRLSWLLFVPSGVGPRFHLLMLRLLIRPLLLNAHRRRIGSSLGECYNLRAKVLRIVCLVVLLLENGARTSL